METFYYVECGRMTLFRAWFPNLNDTKKSEIYGWLINHIRNVRMGPICKKEDCGYVTELFDYRGSNSSDLEPKDYSGQNYWEVNVENNEIDYENDSGPLDTYEECVEWIKDNYTEETINDKHYEFEIQYQKINGEGEYYSYP